jgi:dienelactone hydrolase
MRTLIAALALVIGLSTMTRNAAAEWTRGEFQSNGKPIEEFHCVPSGAGPFPAVVFLHGSGPREMGVRSFKSYCDKLAEHGYYTEFIEYYSQTGAVSPLEVKKMATDFPTWLDEIEDGIDALKKNKSVDSKHLGLMGISLGSFLSLAYGATFPDQIDAIVEYYGGLPPTSAGGAAMMPPTLILHGDADKIVPVSQAKDLDALLTKFDRPHEIHIYPGANHGFNFEGAAMWYDRAAADDAWDHTLKFFDTYLKNNSAVSAHAN